MKDMKPEMIPVPLPTEVPPPPRLDHIPLEILHSATVEMLIQQNEDLSSRLKVNIRRNSQLEQKIIENEKLITELNRKRENVLAQMEIVKEKENLWSSQKQSIERQMQTLSKENDLLELRYTELSATAKQREKEQQIMLVEKQNQLSKLEEKLSILFRVKDRAKEKLRSLLLEMAEGFNKSQIHNQRNESSYRVLQKNFASLRQEIEEKEAFFKEQLQNLKEASKKSLLAMDERVTDLKVQNLSLMNKKEALIKENSNYRDKIHEQKKVRTLLDQVKSDFVEIQNESIKSKREFENALEKSEMARFEKERAFRELQSNIKNILSEKETEIQRRSQCETQILALKKDNDEMSAQLSSMQNLWMQAQAKLEKEELKTQALEKINRQLSQQGKVEKLDRITNQSHSSTSFTKESEARSTEAHDKELQDKIKNVFATQYRTLVKPPNIDV